MAMVTYVCGVIPPDSEWNANANAFNACKLAGVTPPKELYHKLGLEWGTDQVPDHKGMVVHMDDDKELKLAVTPYSDEMEAGYEIDLSKFPEKYKIIRVINRW